MESARFVADQVVVVFVGFSIDTSRLDLVAT